MTTGLMSLLALTALVVLLLIALQHDVRSHCIPNNIVMLGMLLGILLNGLLPQGWGFNSVIPGGLGWLLALQGLGVGLVALLPLYLLRAMGAGDVKLIAMVGAFLGPNDILGVVLATFVTGGLMALIVVMRSKQLGQMLQNIKLILLGGLVKMSIGKLPLMDDLPVSVGKLPYALAITVGTFSFLVWQRMK